MESLRRSPGERDVAVRGRSTTQDGTWTGLLGHRSPSKSPRVMDGGPATHQWIIEIGLCFKWTALICVTYFDNVYLLLICAYYYVYYLVYFCVLICGLFGPPDNFYVCIQTTAYLCSWLS